MRGSNIGNLCVFYETTTRTLQQDDHFRSYLNFLMQLVSYTLFAFAHCGAHTNRTHTIDTSIALDNDVDSTREKIFEKYQTVSVLDLCKEKTQKLKNSTKTFFVVDDLTDLISTNIFQTYIIGKKDRDLLKATIF